MFNRKYESDRPEIFYHFSPYHRPFFPESGYYPPIIDEKLLELDRLFATEEALALRIQDDKQAVDRETIHEVVTVAQKIAQAGYPLRMVPLDEMLDITHLYGLDEPNIQPHTVADWASRGLGHLQKNLQQTDNPAWTARVAATLAYFSKLENRS